MFVYFSFILSYHNYSLDFSKIYVFFVNYFKIEVLFCGLRSNWKQYLFSDFVWTTVYFSPRNSFQQDCSTSVDVERKENKKRKKEKRKRRSDHISSKFQKLIDRIFNLKKLLNFDNTFFCKKSKNEVSFDWTSLRRCRFGIEFFS